MENSDIIKLYKQGLSPLQIKEQLDLPITVRSIQRKIVKLGIARSRIKAFNLAVKQKRLGPKQRRPKVSRLKLPPMLRYMIFKRDKFRCQVCGVTAQQNGILEIDHIDFNVRNNDPFNLQVLCWECNLGKRHSQA